MNAVGGIRSHNGSMIKRCLLRHFVMTALILGISTSFAAEYTVQYTTNAMQLWSSPFAQPDGSSIKITNFVKPPLPSGQFTLSTWDSSNTQYMNNFHSSRGLWIGSSTNNTISRGQGFVLYNGTNSFPLTFTGTLSSASVITNDLTNSLHLIGYPFLASVSITNMNLTNNIIPYVTGHLLRTWIETSKVYRTFFYDAAGELGGGWQDIDDPGKPTDYELKIMEGFWLHAPPGATGILWRAKAP